jgi:hypothetical protein
MTYYKFITNKNESPNVKSFKWDLPTNNLPKAWMPDIEGELEICQHGYHVTTREYLQFHVAPKLFEIEVGGDHVEGDTESAWRKARLIRQIDSWNKQTQRQWAIECCERYLKLCADRINKKERFDEYLESAKSFANNKIGENELEGILREIRKITSNTTSSYNDFSTYYIAKLMERICSIEIDMWDFAINQKGFLNRLFHGNLLFSNENKRQNESILELLDL